MKAVEEVSIIQNNNKKRNFLGLFPPGLGLFGGKPYFTEFFFDIKNVSENTNIEDTTGSPFSTILSADEKEKCLESLSKAAGKYKSLFLWTFAMAIPATILTGYLVSFLLKPEEKGPGSAALSCVFLMFYLIVIMAVYNNPLWLAALKKTEKELNFICSNSSDKRYRWVLLTDTYMKLTFKSESVPLSAIGLFEYTNEFDNNKLISLV